MTGKRITIDGATKTVIEWSKHKRCTVAKSTIYNRLSAGWTPKDAVFKGPVKPSQPDPGPGKKICSNCGETKSVEEFGKSKKNKKGRKPWCKACYKEYQRPYYSKYYRGRKEKILKQHKQYYKNCPLRYTWSAMVRRCTDKNHKDYHRYGARGVKVCDAWRDSYNVFEKWAMANGWEKGLGINRIDNNGDYTPTNVNFVTKKENNRNKSTNILCTYMNETKPVCCWAEDPRCKVKYSTLLSRLHRDWSFARALTTPSMAGGKNAK